MPAVRRSAATARSSCRSRTDEAAPQRSLAVSPLPSRMYVECTAACNVSCLDSCCAPETGITKTRQAGMLDVDLFMRVLAEVGPTLERIDFFNYGEAFLHKRAVEMCEIVKREYPHIYLYTSTNGGALNEESARRLVRSGIDEVTFSVDGASQDVYATYRQRGRFDHVMKNLRAVMDEKRALGRDVPFVNWRYILFKWNDNDAEMQRARTLADRDRRRSPVLGDHRSPGACVLPPLRARHRRLAADSPRGVGRQSPRQRHPWSHAAGPHRSAGALA